MTAPALEEAQAAIPPAAVTISNAHKAFGAHRVLRGIDLTVPAGQVVAIIGPSGSGKSTLLRAINHLERLDVGHVEVDGELIGVRRHRGRLKELSERAILRQRAGIGFVFQDFNLFANLTVLDNVAAAPVATRTASGARARERAHELLRSVGLAEKAGAYPRHLSGGQQQRVAIARALALRPRLLLLDEPTSALDPELVGEVLSLIRALASSGTTMIIVTHEIAFAREVADLVVFVDDGVIVEQGPPSAVLDAPRQARTREFLSRVR